MKRTFKFNGTQKQLAFFSKKLTVKGEWYQQKSGAWTLYTEAGAIMNFWPTALTMNFQGPTKEAAKLKRLMRRALADLKVIAGNRTYTNRILAEAASSSNARDG